MGAAREDASESSARTFIRGLRPRSATTSDAIIQMAVRTNDQTKRACLDQPPVSTASVGPHIHGGLQ
jgi:hypothetical protein